MIFARYILQNDLDCCAQYGIGILIGVDDIPRLQ